MRMRVGMARTGVKWKYKEVEWGKTGTLPPWKLV